MPRLSHDRAGRLRFAVSAFALSASTIVATAAPTYTVEQLGGLGPSTTDSSPAIIEANGVDNAGTAAGYARIGNGTPDLGTQAVRWPAGQGTPQQVDSLPAGGTAPRYATAAAVAGGYTAGYQSQSGSGDRAIRWAPGQTAAQELFGPPSATSVRAYAVNASGVTAGQAVVGSSQAVRWGAGQTAATTLGSLGGPSTAFGINASGAAAGFSGKPGFADRAVVWPAGQTAPVELGFLDSASHSQSRAINDAGVVVGYSREGATQWPARWDPGVAQPTKLPTLGLRASGEPRTFGNAFDVNSAGDAAGVIIRFNEQGQELGNRATLWLNGATSAIDLNDVIAPNSGWFLQRAFGINDDGILVGTGTYDPDGPGGQAPEQAAFRLVPVPEPALLVPAVLLATSAVRLRARRHR